MPKTFHDLVAEARARIKEIDVAGAAAAIASGDIVVVDVREPDEFSRGHIEGAVNIPRGVAEMGIPRRVPDPRTRILCYCSGGNRSALVADNLRQMGYENIESLSGGFQAWTQSDQRVTH
ncbi:MAG: rhodanese-like domain-containing protein [Acidobacteriota bacterium]